MIEPTRYVQSWFSSHRGSSNLASLLMQIRRPDSKILPPKSVGNERYRVNGIVKKTGRRREGAWTRIVAAVTTTATGEK